MSEMKPWPEKPKFPPEFNANSDHYRAAQLDYQRARADAWEARCRVAVEALGRIDSSANGSSGLASSPKFDPVGIMNYAIEQAGDALAAIGPLPEEKT